MSSAKKETVLRTLRIPRQLYETLQRDATERDSNLNAVVSRVLTRYAEWDRYAERFGMVSFSKEVFKGILETAEPGKLFKAAREFGSRTPKAGMLFWFKEATAQTFLAGLSNLFKYGGIGEAEIKTGSSQHVIVIRHDLGMKWSKFLRNYLEAAAESVLSTRPKFDVSSSHVSMRLPVPTSP